MTIKTYQKTLLLEPLQDMITEGEANADEVEIELPLRWGALDLTGLAWEVRAAAEKGAFAACPVRGRVCGERLILCWRISGAFTAAAGKLRLTLAGVSPSGEEIIKWNGDRPIFVRRASSGQYAPEPDALEEALDRVQALRAGYEAAREALGAAMERAEEVAAAAAKTPQISLDGLWWEVYDAQTKSYVKTVTPASLVYAVFSVDAATGVLSMARTAAYMGPEFRINENGELEVMIHV